MCEQTTEQFTQQLTQITDLLPEINNHLFGFLSAADTLFLGLTCKYFAGIIPSVEATPGELALDVTKYGRLELCELILDIEPETLNHACTSAALHGDFRLLKALYFLGCDPDETTALTVVESEALTTTQKCKILKWLGAKHCPWDERCAAEAARLNNLKLLKWILGHNGPWDSKTCAAAAFGGHLDLLKWARDEDCEWDENTVLSAVAGGHIEILEYARANDCPGSFQDESLVVTAAQNGQLKMLKHLIGTGSVWDPEVCASALKLGHLELFDWAFASGCPINLNVALCAARVGNLEALKVVVEAKKANPTASDAFWCRAVGEAAAEGGHVHILDWLFPVENREVPYATMRSLTLLAIEWNSTDVLDWLLRVDDQCLCGLHIVAVRHNRLEILKKIHHSHPRTNNIWACWEAIITNHTHILAWLIGAGYVFDDPDNCRGAACVGNLAALKLLRANGCSWNVKECLNEARKHPRVARWIQKNSA